MRVGHVVLLLATLPGVGCGLIHNAAGTLSSRVDQAVEDCREQKRNRQLAAAAWQAQLAHHPGHYSDEYHDGFEEGFACYLYRGGDGEPPPMAPQRYRGIQYQTPEGYQRVLEWFVGYRYGAWYAKQSGYRELVTGPSALRAPAPPAPVAVPPTQPPAPVMIPPATPPAPVMIPPAVPPVPERNETLPPPREEPRKRAEQAPPPARSAAPAQQQQGASAKKAGGWVVRINLTPWRKPSADDAGRVIRIAVRP